MILIPNNVVIESNGHAYRFWTEKPLRLNLYHCMGLYSGVGLSDHGVRNMKYHLEYGPDMNDTASSNEERERMVKLVKIFEKGGNTHGDELVYLTVDALFNLVNDDSLDYDERQPRLDDITDFVFKEMRFFKDGDSVVRALGYRPLKIEDILRLKK